MRRFATTGLLLCLLGACSEYESIDVDGVEREFLVHMPTGEAPAEGWPLVIAYHGAYSTPEATEDYTRLSNLGDEQGFAVVYPKGKRRLWSDGRIPDDYDDVAFTDALIDHFVADYNVDDQRVFATGISNGGFMSHRVGCELAGRVAAIAPVAGTLSEELVDVCDPATPLPVMLFMGTDDALVPYEGGELGGGLTGRVFGTMLSAPDTAAHWAALNACTDGPAADDPIPELVEVEIDELDDATRIESTHYQECEGRAEVILHSVVGGGHTWPGSEHVLGLGAVSEEIDASREMWRFFRSVTDE